MDGVQLSQGYSAIQGQFIFAIMSLGVPGTQLIDLRRMKGWVNLRTTQWFWTWDPWAGMLHKARATKQTDLKIKIIFRMWNT